ncbi:MAG: hypothetical protein U0235_34185 [Polyangiaceae bacterium]
MIAGIGFAGLAGCRRPVNATGDGGAHTDSSTLAVSVAGCASVVERVGDAGSARVCEVAPAATLTVSAVPTTTIVVRGGAREVGRGPSVRVAVSSVSSLEVETVGAEPRQIMEIALRIRAADPPFIEDARQRKAKGDLAGARDVLAPHADEASPGVRAAVLGLLARVELASGDAERAFPLLRRAIEADRAAGRVSDASDDSFALAFALHQRSQRYSEARATLDAIAPVAASYPEGAARLPYYRGILAGETGDHRTALTLLREAEERARSLGMDRFWARNAASARAVEMQALGRAAASLEGLRKLAAAPDLTPCERAEIATCACRST